MSYNIQDLKPIEDNPFKSKGDEQIQAIGKSIEEFKQMMELRPIVIDENNTILGGNKRFYALKKLGYKKIPKDWIKEAKGLNEEQKKEFLIKDNAHWGSYWDYELLDHWEINPEDHGIWENLEHVGEQVTEEYEEAEEDGFTHENPEEIKTDIKIGSLIKLGEHYLKCGDATQEDMIKDLLGEEKIDLVLTDPPYNVSYAKKNDFLNKFDKGNRNQKDIKNDDIGGQEEYDNFTVEWTGAVKDYLKDYNIFYIFGNYESLKKLYDISYFKASCVLIWVKNNIVLGRKDYFYQHEYILYGWIGKHYFYGNHKTTLIDDEKDSKQLSKSELIKEVQDLKEKIKTDIIREDKPLSSELHPTMKPIKLLGRLLKDGSLHGMNVYDPFGGSGSTLIACEQLQRRCFMIELDPSYCEIICRRWEQHTGKQREIIK